jgi:hypothetical protein
VGDYVNTAAKKELLFFVADAWCPEKTSAAATLAWLAEELGIDFDTYIDESGYDMPPPAELSKLSAVLRYTTDR